MNEYKRQEKIEKSYNNSKSKFGIIVGIITIIFSFLNITIALYFKDLHSAMGWCFSAFSGCIIILIYHWKQTETDELFKYSMELRNIVNGVKGDISE